MQLLHEPADGDPRPLATEIEVADSFVSRARGLMFRHSIPAEFALVFPFGRPAKRGLHMVFVAFPIDAVWLVDDEVTAKKRLHPWRGYGRARADTILELPAGAADDVTVGDRIVLDR